MSINTWVDSNTKDMLVVLGENAWANDVAPRRSLALLDENRRDDASRTSLNSNGACLIKDVLDFVLAAEISYRLLHKMDSR